MRWTGTDFRNLQRLLTSPLGLCYSLRSQQGQTVNITHAFSFYYYFTERGQLLIAD